MTDSSILVLRPPHDIWYHDGFRCSWVALRSCFNSRPDIATAAAGWFADRSASRQVPLLTGLGLAFTSTLLFCFAKAPLMLVVARMFQGFSASIIYTAGLALIADTVPAEDVGSWYRLSTSAQGTC